jgi:hypothetical protein
MIIEDWTVDVEETFQIKIVQSGAVEVVNKNIPETVLPDTEFPITYTIKNTSNTTEIIVAQINNMQQYAEVIAGGTHQFLFLIPGLLEDASFHFQAGRATSVVEE